jgi:hypothetical protein
LAFAIFSLTGIARMDGTAAVEAVGVMAKVLIVEPRRIFFFAEDVVEEVWLYTM